MKKWLTNFGLWCPVPWTEVLTLHQGWPIWVTARKLAHWFIGPIPITTVIGPAMVHR